MYCGVRWDDFAQTFSEPRLCKRPIVQERNSYSTGKCGYDQRHANTVHHLITMLHKNWYILIHVRHVATIRIGVHSQNRSREKIFRLFGTRTLLGLMLISDKLDAYKTIWNKSQNTNILLSRHVLKAFVGKMISLLFCSYIVHWQLPSLRDLCCAFPRLHNKTKYVNAESTSMMISFLSTRLTVQSRFRTVSITNT